MEENTKAGINDQEISVLCADIQNYTELISTKLKEITNNLNLICTENESDYLKKIKPINEKFVSNNEHVINNLLTYITDFNNLQASYDNEVNKISQNIDSTELTINNEEVEEI